MAHDGTPWFTGGGAEHSPDIARILPYITLEGSEGVVRPTDCRCLSMPVATNRIRVMTGAYAILNRALGGDSQMYLGRVTSQDEVETTPTGSGGGRTDLVIIRVENPYPSGESWPTPSDVKNGPYVFTRIIEGVPANTTSVKQLNLGYSAIAVARINFPPSTSTVSQAMITDLRPVAQAGFGDRLEDASLTKQNWRNNYKYGSADIMTNSSFSVTSQWPLATATMKLPIPANCTDFDYVITFANLQHDFANIWGEFTLAETSGAFSSASNSIVDYNKFDVDQWVNGGIRVNPIISGNCPVPAASRGKVATVKTNYRSYLNNAGTLRFDTSSIAMVDVSFNIGAVLA